MSGWRDKLEGKAKEVKGKVTGDRLEEMKGKAQESWGDAQGKMGDLKDAWKRRQADQTATGEPESPIPTAEGYQPDEGQPVE
jgi:uncharacterized protein YjbJ (UPF0337 family)